MGYCPEVSGLSLNLVWGRKKQTKGHGRWCLGSGHFVHVANFIRPLLWTSWLSCDVVRVWSGGRFAWTDAHRQDRRNFFSPVCVRRCLDSSSERANFLSHPSQWQLKGFSPEIQRKMVNNHILWVQQPIRTKTCQIDTNLYGFSNEPSNENFWSKSSCILGSCRRSFACARSQIVSLQPLWPEGT